MGETDAILGIFVCGGLIVAVLFVGLGFFNSFYDLDSFDADGDLDIDTDAIDDLETSVEDASEAIFENWDMDAFTTTLTSWAVLIGIVIGIVAIIYMIAR